MQLLMSHPAEAYAVAYFGVIITLVLLEWFVPRQPSDAALLPRWIGNIGITILDTFVLRLLFPVAGFAWALICTQRGWGLFNRVSLPGWLVFILTLVVLDLYAYVQHYVLHRVPFLWRLHRTHHSDQEFDFTTGLRFHPLESIITTFTGLALIALLGPPAAAVLLSELIVLTLSFWEHANVRVPMVLDRRLRLLIVTPEIHRTHHSRDARECQSNFGNLTTWWDRLFGTYRDQPLSGQEIAAFGVSGFEARKHLTLPWMLVQPFLTDKPGVPRQ